MRSESKPSKSPTVGVLYVYRCICGHHGELHFADDSHDGKTTTCTVCGAPVQIEWDGGVTFKETPTQKSE
jgi:hypothetical protein